MDNLTIDKLADMTPEERLAAFDALVEARYGGAGQIAERVGHDLGVSRASYHNWRAKPKSLPDMAIMLLSAWQMNDSPDAIAESFRETAEGLERATVGLAKVLKLTGRL